MTQHRTMPAPAAALGYAGLIPFAGTALGVAIGVGADAMTGAFTAYAATILAFLGGIQWGLAFHFGAERRLERVAVGVMPSLVAWICLLLPTPGAIAILAVGFAAIHGYDELRNIPQLPIWFGRLRRHLTSGVLLCHAGILAAITL